MPFWRKTETDTVIINEVSDDDEDGDTLAVVQTGEKVKKKSKKQKEKENKENELANLSPEEREMRKEALKYKKDPTLCDYLLFDKTLRIVYVILLTLLLGIFIPYILANYRFNTGPIPNYGVCALNVSYRYDCVPGDASINSNKTECHDLGCCFDLNKQDDLYAPVCFQSIPPKYSYTDATHTLGNDQILFLDNATNLTMDLNSMKERTPFNTPAWPLKLLVQRGGNDVLRLKLWNDEHFPNDSNQFVEAACDGLCQLDVQVDVTHNYFNIRVYRVATNVTVFETAYGPIVYGEGYMEITTRLNTPYLYGLGQRERETFDLLPTFSSRSRWTLYNREDGTGATYGSHPFYMNFEEDGNMHGVYVRTAAPLEVAVTPVPGVSMRSIEGVFDLRVMAGPTPRAVTDQYTTIVGRPAMPPRWALGYHLCRTNADDAEYDSVVEGMEANHVPYESDCIDARLAYPNTFAALSDVTLERVANLTEAGRKFLLVQYPFVDVTSPSYDEAVMLKLNQNNESLPYYGQVEDVAVGYPDFCADDTYTTWLGVKPNIRDLYNMTDGVMLFMNTPVNQALLEYGGQCNSSSPQYCCPDNTPRPFLPKGLQDLNNGTTCSLTHSLASNLTGLQMHNVYGRCHHEQVARLMQDLGSNQRAMVTSVSTFPGSGVSGGHFGGQYPADFVAQRKALTQVLEMGLYGVSLAGVPVCGSTNSSTGELKTEWCLRGHQSAAFWPLMVSHYEAGHSPRNPTNFPNGLMANLRIFIQQRYVVIPYLYTLFHEAHLTGAPVVRPLFWEFPLDQGSRSIGHQFLLGGGLLVTPVFSLIGDSSSVKVLARFPPGTWYNFYSGSLVSSTSEGEDLTLTTLITDVNVHLRAGHIVPIQGNIHEIITHSQDMQTRPYAFMVALPSNITTTTPTTTTSTTEQPPDTRQLDVYAEGNIYIDDGVSSLDDDLGYTVHLNATSTSFSITIPGIPLGKNYNFGDQNSTIDYFWVFGLPLLESSVLGINGTVTCDTQACPTPSFRQDPDTLTLKASNWGYDWCIYGSATVTWA